MMLILSYDFILSKPKNWFTQFWMDFFTYWLTVTLNILQNVKLDDEYYGASLILYNNLEVKLIMGKWLQSINNVSDSLEILNH